MKSPNTPSRHTRRTQCKIATVIRRMDANVKTRVGIEWGELWPTISTKFRGAPRYERVPEQVFNTAKEVVIKEKKAENDKRKKEREDRLLEADGKTKKHTIITQKFPSHIYTV